MKRKYEGSKDSKEGPNGIIQATTEETPKNRNAQLLKSGQYELKRNTHRENQIKSTYASDLSLLKKRNQNLRAGQDQAQIRNSQDPSFFNYGRSPLRLEAKPDRISLVEKERQSQERSLSRVASDFKMAVSNKKRMAVLMDILQDDQKDINIKELLSDAGTDMQKSTTRFP